MTRDEVLLPEHLPPQLLRASSAPAKAVVPGSLASAKADAEKMAIETALKAARGNKSRAADLLRIHRVTLYEKMKRYGLPPDGFRNG